MMLLLLSTRKDEVRNKKCTRHNIIRDELNWLRQYFLNLHKFYDYNHFLFWENLPPLLKINSDLKKKKIVTVTFVKKWSKQFYINHFKWVQVKYSIYWRIDVKINRHLYPYIPSTQFY